MQQSELKTISNGKVGAMLNNVVINMVKIILKC